MGNTAFNGTYDRNPFNFEYFNLTLMQMSVYSDGQQQYGIKPLTTDFANELYVRPYNTMFSGTGKIYRDEDIAIDRNDYANGYALYTFDLTADQGDEENFNLMRQGSVRLVLKFSQALATTVTVVVYAEFENVIEIDRNRNIIYDFGA